MKHVLAQIIFLCGVMWLAPAQAVAIDCQHHHCMAIIDAGSTKSRLQVYQYDLNAVHFPIHIETIGIKQITPGLANLTDATLPHYLDDLMQGMPEDGIPVSLYATGGMRLLSKAAQQHLYQGIHAWFTAHPGLHLNEARTITGQEEGLFDWLAVNEVQGRFGADAQDYLGVMDMGGASVQVVFPVLNPEGVDAHDLKTVWVQGRRILLFVHSFLGLGRTEILHQLMDERGCYTTGYPMTEDSARQGTGVWAACEQKVEWILKAHDVDKIVVPALSTNAPSAWYVLGGLSALVQKPLLHLQAKDWFYPGELAEQGRQVLCESAWETLQATHPADSYLATECLASAYYNALLVQGYGLSQQQPLQFSESMASEVSWTLGALITIVTSPASVRRT